MIGWEEFAWLELFMYIFHVVVRYYVCVIWGSLLCFFLNIDWKVWWQLLTFLHFFTRNIRINQIKPVRTLATNTTLLKIFTVVNIRYTIITIIVSSIWTGQTYQIWFIVAGATFVGILGVRLKAQEED